MSVNSPSEAEGETPSPDRLPPERVAWAVMLLAMSLLAFELIITRLFSVILWNHFAFLAISIGLFGFGIAGTVIYLMPRFFGPDRAAEQLRRSCLLLPVVIWATVAILCSLPIRMDFSGEMFQLLSIIFLLTALPFAVGGAGITLALTHWPRAVNRIYAFDLVGSALGCILVIAVLHWLDGPTAALAIAVLPAAGALTLRRSPLALAMVAVILLGAGLNAGSPLVRVKIARSKVQNPVFEQWNAFSRVAVGGMPNAQWRGWWVSPNTASPPLDAMGITIDGDAFTPLIHFSGDYDAVSVLLEDVTAPVYSLRPGAEDVLVFGAGGGKDVLSALISGAGHVKAIELNPIIARSVVSETFREYTGDLYRHPQVELVVSEGRTALRREQGLYDILQISMVDTSAASAAGAYALTENSLYTLDAAVEYLSHLKEGGILSVTWANFPNLEGVNRLVVLFAEALRLEGHGSAAARIAVLGTPDFARGNYGLGTVLVKPEGFTPDDTLALERIAQRLDFQALYLPGRPTSGARAGSTATFLYEILNDPNAQRLLDAYPLDLSPVGDDRPFFFYQNRIGDLKRALLDWNPGTLYGNGLFIIAKLLVISGVAVLAFMLLPLLAAPGLALKDLRGHGAFMLYFLCLGAGFIILEIALVQMFGYYLGHPLLGLGISLASMLLFTGLGSALGGRFHDAELFPRLRVVLILALLLPILYAGVLHGLTAATVSWPVLARCVLVLLVIAPLGLLLGMPFPSGLRMLRDRPGITPWMWAINGGASVFGATLATLVVMHLGFSRTLVVGAAFYGIALIAVTIDQRRARGAARAAAS